MYFESRKHELKECESIPELLNTLKNSPDYIVPVIKNNKGESVAFVADGHIDNIRLEIAIINLSTQTQTESWNFGWVKDNSESILINTVKDLIENKYIFRKNVILPLYDNSTTLKHKSDFTCRCCGKTFQSTIQYQEQFDQDNGFGICPECEGSW